MPYCLEKRGRSISTTPNAFEVYGFSIEVHAGGRPVWPPSFKRFIKNKLDSRVLTVAEVMKTCKVSQSLIYKWGADVKASRAVKNTVSEERMFSEVLIDEEAQPADKPIIQDRIHFTTRVGTLDFPATYPVDNLVKIILAVNARP